ncbi:MAG: acyl-CoA dehydrogenase family protein [Dehalococcoidia bacterium]
MDFSFTPQQEAFRGEIRSFLADNLDPSLRADDDVVLGIGTGEDERDRDWLKKLATRNWVAPAWPTEYGGAGLSVMEQFVFNEEMALARAPKPNFLAIGLAGPTIMVHGDDEQKREHLQGILSGEVYWCQGFSEPGSGSDLASLQTRAIRDGDDYVVNGQKIWTSGGHRSDRMMLLARTDTESPKHKGISYFLLDMHSPGITIQPLDNMAGTHSFNQIYFDNVRVPVSDLLGEENRGWYYAVTTLDFERSSINSAASLQALLDEITSAAATHIGRHQDGSSARYELADRYIETQVARMMSYWVVSIQAAGRIPNAEASIAKLFAAELSQRIAKTATKLFGLYGQVMPGAKDAPLGGRAARMYLAAVGSTLAGGTSEIQRSVIAGRGLGLPRE